MMIRKLTAILAIAIGLTVAACSDNEAATTETGPPAATPQAPADADDDTLEPEAPAVEEAEEHNEDAPHSH